MSEPMNARELIAKVIWEEVREVEDQCDIEWNEMDGNHLHFVAADAILAAMPGIIRAMVVPLAWDGNFAKTPFGYYWTNEFGAWGLHEPSGCHYTPEGAHGKCETEDLAKDAASGHYAAQIMKGLGL